MKPAEIIDQYRDRLDQLRELSKKAGMPIENDLLLERLLQKQYFEIAFVGEFTSGKSSLVNALLGEDLLPTKLEPTTARVTRIKYAEKPSILLINKDNTKKELKYNPKILHEFIASNPSEVANVSTIEVGYPAEFLKDGFVLIDTPGTNDTNAERVKITYELLPEVDAVVYVTIHPVTESNLESFRTHILGNNLEQVIIVLNKRDLFINELEKVSSSVEENFSNRLGKKITIPVISAADYLDGILQKDDGLIEASHMKDFILLLDEYLKGSSKYESLEKQYQFQFEKIKAQTSDLMATRIASLVVPEDVFEQKKKTLQTELAACEKETLRVKEDTSAELRRLTNKLDESLDKLYDELMEQVSLMIDQHQGDVRLIMRNIEMTVRKHYDGWRMRNEPVVNKFISNLRDEIKIRLGKVATKIDSSLVQFRSDALAKYSSELQKDNIAGLLTDQSKSRAGISLAAGVGAVVATTLFGLTGGIALVLAPLAMMFADKKRKEQILAVKAEAMAKMREDAESFKETVLNNLYGLDNQLIGEIQKVFTQYIGSINKQLDDVEDNRKKLEKDLDKQARDLMEIKVKVEAV